MHLCPTVMSCPPTIKRSQVSFKFFKKSEEFQLSARDDHAMGRKKDMKKTVAGKRLTEGTKWRIIFLKKEGQLSN